LVSGHHIGTHCRSDAFCAGTLKVEYEKLHKTVLTIVREDAVCRRLMTVPRAANRQWKSQSHREVKGGRSPVRAHAEKYQSGEKDATSGITRAGDEMVRTAPADIGGFVKRQTRQGGGQRRCAASGRFLYRRASSTVDIK
jgi:transposase